MADHATTSTTSTGLNLSNGAYDILRRLVEKVLPGVGVLYFTLAHIWGEQFFPHPDNVVGSLAAIAIFGGVLLTLSRKGYDTSGAAYDGALVPDTTDPENPVYRLQLDPTNAEDILNKKQIVFKGLDPSA